MKLIVPYTIFWYYSDLYLLTQLFAIAYRVLFDINILFIMISPCVCTSTLSGYQDVDTEDFPIFGIFHLYIDYYDFPYICYYSPLYPLS